MGVHVDRAGHQVATGRIDGAVRLDRHTGPDRRDLLPLDQDVGSHGLRRRHHRAALDQRPHCLPFIRSVFNRGVVIR